jgi:hypothetical protein
MRTADDPHCVITPHTDGNANYRRMTLQHDRGMHVLCHPVSGLLARLATNSR